MMTHAYQEIYLDNAQSVLGDAFDYAVNVCKIPGNNFVKLFLASSVRARMEKGEPSFLSGKSGIEIVLEILAETKSQNLQSEIREQFGRTREYWIGWALAQYQWYSGRKYTDIFKVLSFDDFERMYFTLHEADISKFVDIVDFKMKEHFTETNLKYIRTIYGITQSELAERSGVSLRSIQMYEQRNKNINKD